MYVKPTLIEASMQIKQAARRPANPKLASIAITLLMMSMLAPLPAAGESVSVPMCTTFHTRLVGVQLEPLGGCPEMTSGGGGSKPDFSSGQHWCEIYEVERSCFIHCHRSWDPSSFEVRYSANKHSGEGALRMAISGSCLYDIESSETKVVDDWDADTWPETKSWSGNPGTSDDRLYCTLKRHSDDYWSNPPTAKGFGRCEVFFTY